MEELFPGLKNLANIHPLFVHFPIALVLVTLLFEAMWWISNKDQFRLFATWLLHLSALAAAAAAVTGLLASNGLGHDAPNHEFVHQHRDIMYWMTGLLLVTSVAVASLRKFRQGAGRRVLIFPLLVISGLLVYGADKGGRLVFDLGMGVRAKTAPAAEHDSTSQHQHDDGQPNAHDH